MNLTFLILFNLDSSEKAVIRGLKTITPNLELQWERNQEVKGEHNYHAFL